VVEDGYVGFRFLSACREEAVCFDGQRCVVSFWGLYTNDSGFCFVYCFLVDGVFTFMYIKQRGFNPNLTLP